MNLMVHDVVVPLDRTEEDLPRFVAKRLKIHPRSILKTVLQRRSLDCRRGRAPRWVCSVLVELVERERKRCLESKKARIWEPDTIEVPELSGSDREISHRPVVVGTGPAGLFCAWRLMQGGIQPRILERGPEVVERSKRWHQFIQGGEFDPECHLLYGEGGAGTYSDGKLYTRVHDPRVSEVLQILVDHGAPEEILVDGRPHIGSNLLPSIVKRMRLALEEKGSEFFFGHRLNEIAIGDDEDHRVLSGIEVQSNTGEESWPVDSLFLATGHSARDVYRMLEKQRVPMSQKPFQIGVRVEHPQLAINQMQYGEAAGHPKLPAADYSLISKKPEKDVYSFCMCPGGEILPSTEREGFLCVNGASRYQRKSPWANSGFVVTLTPDMYGLSGGSLAGIEYQEKIEKAAFTCAGGDFSVPALRLRDFLEGQLSVDLPASSYPRKLVPVLFEEFLPDTILEPLRLGLSDLVQRFPEFGDPDSIVTGPESRSSSPVRLDRNPQTFESEGLKGLYPIGEGAGYAGGILSAALDGMKAAERWMATIPNPSSS